MGPAWVKTPLPLSVRPKNVHRPTHLQDYESHLRAECSIGVTIKMAALPIPLEQEVKEDGADVIFNYCLCLQKLHLSALVLQRAWKSIIYMF